VIHSSMRSCSKVFHHSVHEVGNWKKLLKAPRCLPGAPLAVFTRSEFPVPYSLIDQVSQGILSGMTPKLLHPRQSTDVDSNV